MRTKKDFRGWKTLRLESQFFAKLQVVCKHLDMPMSDYIFNQLGSTVESDYQRYLPAVKAREAERAKIISPTAPKNERPKGVIDLAGQE
jgi:hypothetical protein